MKVRVRFGIRLSWPIANAAIFVFRVDERFFETLSNAVSGLATALIIAGQHGLAARLVCERS